MDNVKDEGQEDKGAFQRRGQQAFPPPAPPGLLRGACLVSPAPRPPRAGAVSPNVPMSSARRLLQDSGTLQPQGQPGSPRKLFPDCPRPRRLPPRPWFPGHALLHHHRDFQVFPHPHPRGLDTGEGRGPCPALGLPSLSCLCPQTHDSADAVRAPALAICFPCFPPEHGRRRHSNTRVPHRRGGETGRWVHGDTSPHHRVPLEVSAGFHETDGRSGTDTDRSLTGRRGLMKMPFSGISDAAAAARTS